MILVKDLIAYLHTVDPDAIVVMPHFDTHYTQMDMYEGRFLPKNEAQTFGDFYSNERIAQIGDPDLKTAGHAAFTLILE